MKKELHTIQQKLLEKYGVENQLDKLMEELNELHHEIFWFDGETINILNKDSFLSEFADVKILMQQIESALDHQRLAEMMEKKLEKAKTKYLDK